eukprot:1654772-Alexandrium_andersonii.AAC.1
MPEPQTDRGPIAEFAGAALRPHFARLFADASKVVVPRCRDFGRGGVRTNRNRAADFNSTRPNRNRRLNCATAYPNGC